MTQLGQSLLTHHGLIGIRVPEPLDLWYRGGRHRLYRHGWADVEEALAG